MDRAPLKVPASAPLVDALLDAAGLRGPWRVVEVATVGWVNTTTVVEGPSCGRVAVRVYGWPFPEPCPFDRRAKEAAVLEVLSAAGASVPRVLGLADHEGERASLLTYVEGETLGAVAGRVPASELTEVWRQAGAALRRVHSIDPTLLGADPSSQGGWLTAEGVLPFREGSFAERTAVELVARAEGLARAGAITSAEQARIAAVARAAGPHLGAVRPAVAHGDSNPWNLMVRREATDQGADEDGRWVFSGWLDWELAWLADPVGDHVRATLQRFAPIGPAPTAWWEGYGTPVDPRRLAVLSLHHLCGVWVRAAAGERSPEVREALNWHGSLGDRLTEIEERHLA